MDSSLFYIILISLLPPLPTGAQIRLAGDGSTGCSGRVEVLHDGQWGTVCDDDWGLSDAEVVCRQLNCGTAVGATHSAWFGQGSGDIWLDDMQCSGDEDSLTQCQGADFGAHNCGHSEDAGVVCSVDLPKPSISVSPSGQVLSSQGVSVTCSIQTQFSKGIFILRRSNWDMTSANNPATFNFNVTYVDNNRPYYCLYQMSEDISGQSVSSPQSDPVVPRVAVPLLLVVIPACAGVLLLVFLLMYVLHKRRVEQTRGRDLPPQQVQDGDIYVVPQSAYTDDYEVLSINENDVQPYEEHGEELGDDKDNNYEDITENIVFDEDANVYQN